MASGEPAALRECIDTYGALVWSLARRLSRTPSDAEDAVQEIFLQLWSQAGRFDGSKGSEHKFITVMARRRLIDRLRKARTEPLADSELENLVSSVWTHSSNESETCIEVDEALQALQELPLQTRRVIELGCMCGFTHTQVAARTGLPLGTVKTRMRRGLLTMRARLQGEAEAQAKIAARYKPAIGSLGIRQRKRRVDTSAVHEASGWIDTALTTSA